MAVRIPGIISCKEIELETEVSKQSNWSNWNLTLQNNRIGKMARTKNQINASWNRWALFCQVRGCRRLPASLVDLEAFFTDMVQTGVDHEEMAAVARDLETVHRQRGLPSPLANDYLQGFLSDINEP